MSTYSVGILGAGQLGRMLALAGYPLGLRFRFFDPTPAGPAGQLAEQVVAAYDDEAALAHFAHGLDLVGYEFENVPVTSAAWLATRLPVFPPPQALAVAQDRIAEKQCATALGIATPAFAAVATRSELDAAIAQIGLPAVLKTRRLGYDGKGQYWLRTPHDLDPAWQALGSVPLICERRVSFERELSVLAVRGRDDTTTCYPLIENLHRDGILHRSIAPAPCLSATLQAQAEQIAYALLDKLGYVGVLAIELFQVGDRLLLNEIAPRVHNSGHWTIEGAITSQFENHLRAMLGLPLGSTAARGCCAMLNLVGQIPDPRDLLALPDTHLHLYGKAPRPRRKLGHLTVLAADYTALNAQLAMLEEALEACRATDDTPSSL